MRTRIVLGSWLLIAMANAQTPWVLPGNTGINPSTDYLGTQTNADLLLRTNAVKRFRLLPDATYTIGSFATQVKDGSLLLSPDVDLFYAAGALGPYSLLHLAAADNTAQQDSYRAWMKTGISFTGNSDQGYVGQKEGEFDFTDMVAHWSDNPGKQLKDRFRFIFTSGFDPLATTGATSGEGLEGMRLYPVNFDEVNVGLGDFYAANTAVPMTVTEPTERLDLLNGRVRVRDLPTDPVASTLEKYLVVDDVDPSSPEYGVIKWRNLPTTTTAPDNCEWRFETTPTDLDVVTAFGSPLDCPGDLNNVGVGIGSPTSKLHVVDLDQSGGTTTSDIGLTVEEQGGDGENIGIQVENNRVSPVAFNSPGINKGIQVFVNDAHDQYGITSSVGRSSGFSGGNLFGVHSGITAAAPVADIAGFFTHITSSSTVGRFYGVKSRAQLINAGAANEVYGVYGYAVLPTA